jgi:succinate dehydrogenase/fumarate reductase cytochrome b subunit
MRKQVTKKEIPASTVVKGLITGFISYGILVYFLILVIMLGINYGISLLPHPNTTILSVSIPLLCGLFIYFLTHSICKLSTVDLFSKCKTNKENYQEINSKMKTFFVILTIVLVIVANIILCVRILNTESSINIASSQYSQVFSKEFTSDLTSKMVADYHLHKTQTMISTLITEIAIILGLLTCVPLQEKFIVRYNDVKKDPAPKEEKAEPKAQEKVVVKEEKSEPVKKAVQSTTKKPVAKKAATKPKSANTTKTKKAETK